MKVMEGRGYKDSKPSNNGKKARVKVMEGRGNKDSKPSNNGKKAIVKVMEDKAVAAHAPDSCLPEPC